MIILFQISIVNLKYRNFDFHVCEPVLFMHNVYYYKVLNDDFTCTLIFTNLIICRIHYTYTNIVHTWHDHTHTHSIGKWKTCTNIQ